MKLINLKTAIKLARINIKKYRMGTYKFFNWKKDRSITIIIDNNNIKLIETGYIHKIFYVSSKNKMIIKDTFHREFPHSNKLHYLYHA